jgi:hypothetical protein
MKNEKLFQAVQAVRGKLCSLTELAEKEKTTARELIYGGIPDKLVNNAIKAYASGADKNDVYLLVDTTIFGSAKEGLLVTPTTLYADEKGESPVKADYADITSTEIVITADTKGNDDYANLIIHTKNGDIRIDNYVIYKSVLKKLIDSLVALKKSKAI